MRLVALAAGLLLAFAGPAAAQTYKTPNALLSAFYQSYLDNDLDVDQVPFRSAALEALYEADEAATEPGDQGALSFDPYIVGQDWELSDLQIGEPVISGKLAEVEVSFRNFGDETQLSYELVRESGGWRINDVVSDNADNSYRLSEIFLDAAE